MKKLIALLALAATTGCASEDLPPLISPLTDQHATVGSEMLLTVRGTDPEGGELTFDFAADRAAIGDQASLRKDGDQALFRWTPLASDVGVHTFEFSVSDGQASATETISIIVELSDKGGTAPTFVQPLGTGTTLDLRQRGCLEVPIVVEDPDSASVAIELAEPTIDGAAVDPLDQREAVLSWCPDARQIEAADRYTLALTAGRRRQRHRLQGLPRRVARRQRLHLRGCDADDRACAQGCHQRRCVPAAGARRR